MQSNVKKTKLNSQVHQDYEIVYSDDPQYLEKKSAVDVESVDPAKTQLKLRIEKNQRGGKIVTVIFNLPDNPIYFLDLTKKIKNHCGTGGTYKDNQIEIQGDHRDKIQIFLNKIGFNVR